MTAYMPARNSNPKLADRGHQASIGSTGSSIHSNSSYREPARERAPSPSVLISSGSYSSGALSGPRKMTNTVRASNRSAILAVGEELRQLLHAEEPPLIKDRRYHLKTYPKCFVGHDMVDWLLKKGEVESRSEAVAMMQKLLENGVIHHVCDDHPFRDEKLFYRFRKDDGSYTEPIDAAILAKGQRLYGRVTSDDSNLIQDRKYFLTTYKKCFIGREFVDWMVSKGEASNREEAVETGRQLLDAGVFRHVCDDHHFKDEYLFYRFKNDEKARSPHLNTRVGGKKSSSKKNKNGREDDAGSHGSSENRGSGASWDSMSASDTPPPQRSPEVEEYVHMAQPSPQLSPHPSPVLRPQVPNQPPQPVQSNGAVPTPSSTGGAPQRPTVDQLTDSSGPYMKRAVDVVSDPVGYGFVIRGSRPVYVHTIDPSGPAAAAGLQVGEYLYSVNGQNVLNASHTDAARIILMGPSTASLVTFIERDRLPSH